MSDFKPENCCECGEPLTVEEITEFWSGPKCCSGYMCGCRGLPIDPPYCFKCLGKEQPIYRRCDMITIKRIDVVRQQGVRTFEHGIDFTSVSEIRTSENSVRYVLFKGNKLVHTISDSVPVVIDYLED